MGIRDSVVLLDHGLPSLDGISAARELRKMNPDQKIVIATSDDIPKSTIAEEKLFDIVIRKPFTISELLGTIERITSPIEIKGSWILDTDEIDRKYLEVLNDSEEKACICLTAKGVMRRIDAPGYVPFYVRARSKAMNVQLITEITKDNLFYCKELMMNRGVQLRHVDGLLMNFTVWDRKHTFEAILTSDNSIVLREIFYSSVKQIVNKNQFLFDELWKVAVPGEEKISELDSGVTQRSEVTLISDPEKILNVRIDLVRNAKSSLEVCSIVDSHTEGSSSEIREAWIKAFGRGVRARQITEITSENIGLCKDLLERGMDLRHVNGMQGGFMINEEEMLAIASPSDSEAGLQYVYSNFPLIVNQHRTIFNNLWNIAIPASARTREIEGSRENEIRNNRG